MKNHSDLNVNYISRCKSIWIGLPALSILIFLLGTTAVSGQAGHQRQPSRGFQFANSYASNGLDAVNVSNGNVMINLPIASLPAGRGTSPGFTVSLQYNSKLWDSRQHSYTDGLPPGSQDLPLEPTYAYNTNILRPSDRGGWRMLSSYRLIETSRLNLEEPNPCTHGHPVEKLRARWKLEMEFPDGTVRQFIPTNHSTSVYEGYYNVDSNGRRYWASTQPHPNGICTTALNEAQVSTSGMHYVTTDGSRLRLFVPYQSGNWKMYYPDGTVVENAPPDDPLIQKITERNGGKIEIRGSEIVDQMGRSITLGGNGVSVKGVDGETVTTQIAWGSRWVRREYKTVGAGETVPSGTATSEVMHTSVQTVESITLPSQFGGQSYTFDYYASNTQPTGTNYTSGWGELKSVTLPSGAKATYVYDLTTGVENTAEEVLDNKVYQRQLEHTDSYDSIPTLRAETSYYDSFPGVSSFSNPDGTGMLEQSYFNSFGPEWNSGLAYRSSTADGTKVERIWKQNLPHYSGNPYTALMPGNANAYVKTEFTTITNVTGQNHLTAIKDFSYDKNGNVTKVTEYDWVGYGSVPRQNGQPSGIPAGAVVKRITVNEYYNQAPDSESTASSSNTYENPASPKLKNVLKATEIQDGGGVPVSRSEFFYDEPNEKGNLIETRVWDNTKAGLNAPDANGNRLYTNGSVANYISTTTVYDPHGNPTLTTDANGNQTQITYGPINGPTATYSGLYPTEVKAAYNTAIQQTSQTEYDFYTGQPKKVTALGNTAAENVVAETVYDALGRPKIAKSAVGTAAEAWTRTDYNDVLRRVIVRSDLFAKDDGKKVVVQHFDQLGRVRLARTLEDAATQDAADETHGIKVQTRYLSANPFSYTLTSNPYRADYSANETAPTMGWTRSKAWSSAKKGEAETFSGSALPAPWGTSAASTGKVVTESDANASTVTDQSERKRRSVTNALGQLIRVDEPDGNGQLDVGGVPYQPTVYAYDTLNNLKTVTQAGSGTDQCGPSGGNCSQTRTFTYSTLSRLLTANNPESGTISYGYDANGNLTSKTDARSIATSYVYDALNRVTARNYANEPAGSETPDVAYTYDGKPNARGKLTKVSSSVSTTEYTAFDILGRVTGHKQTTDGNDYATAYAYNLSGALIEQTYPSGRKVHNVLDSNGDLEMVKSRKNANSGYWAYANNFTYNAAGAVTSMQLGNGAWESTVFNSRLQPTQIALGATKNASGLLRLDYGYGTTANNGNVLSQTITVSTVATNNGFVAIQSYTYDSLNRLKDATEMLTPNGGSAAQSWKQTFNYDRYGNRNFDEANTSTLPRNCGTSPNLTVCMPDRKKFNPTVSPNSNRIVLDQDNDGVNDYNFDSSGNTTKDADSREFTYDVESKQVQVTNSANVTLGKYWYDGDGRRVKKEVPGTGEVTVFVYDAMDALVAEYSTVIASADNAKVAYLSSDSLGSPRIITDKNGTEISRRDFTPFGERLPRQPSVSDEIRQNFTGKQRDAENGLDYFFARYYNGKHGRFTSPDEFVGGHEELFILGSGDEEEQALPYADIEEPQSLNKYQYCLNNPLRYVDHDGHKAQETNDDKRRRAAQGAVVHSGRTLRKDGNLRREYQRRASKLSGPGSSDARKSLQKEIRQRSTPLGRALAETGAKSRKGQLDNKTPEQRVKSSTKTNAGWNKFGTISRGVGKSFIAAGAASSAYNIATAPEGERGRVVAEEGGAWAGAIAGGAGGAKVGAVVGSFIGGPGAGTAIGAGVGGVLGGAGGAIAGSEVGKRVYNWFAGNDDEIVSKVVEEGK